jgi:hypothetical protein
MKRNRTFKTTPDKIQLNLLANITGRIFMFLFVVTISFTLVEVLIKEPKFTKYYY